MQLRCLGHGTRYGHGASHISCQSYRSKKDFVADWANSARTTHIIIWLRGGSIHYSYRSLRNNVVLTDHNAAVVNLGGIEYTNRSTVADKVSGRRRLKVNSIDPGDANVTDGAMPVVGALSLVEELRGVQHSQRVDMDDRQTAADHTAVGTARWPTGNRYGFLAQEVEAVAPELVSTLDDDIKAVSYDKLTALLSEAVKEMSGTIKELRDTIERLNARVEDLERHTGTETGTTGTHGEYQDLQSEGE